MRSPLAALAEVLDRRIGRRAPTPGVWATDVGALLGHAAIVAFALLAVTGIALSVAYRPSVATVVYHGSSPLYEGRELPGAFASVVRISEDLPGGLLLRRLHVAAAHLFMLAVVAHLLRTLATGAFRRPRTLTHLLGVALLLVGLGFVYTGELLPFGLVAGSSLRIAEAILYSLPLVGEQLGVLLFGGELPSQRFLWIVWVAHVLVLPVLFVGLLYGHLRLVHRHRPALRPRPDLDVETVAAGRALWPDTIARLGLLGAGLTALLLFSAAAVPWSDIEIEGPFLTAEATNSVHPPWPLFFLTGSLRILPALDVVVAGVRITNVLVAGVVLPGLLVLAVTAYPWIERAVLRDRAEHHRLDHPLDVPFRAGVVVGMTSFALVLSLGAGIDVLSRWLATPVERVATTFRVLLATVPVVAAALAVAAARRRVARHAAAMGPAAALGPHGREAAR